MMANPPGRGPCAPPAAALGMVVLVLASASVTPAVAGDSVLPLRSPRALLADEPWPGFRPDAWDAADEFPLGPIASRERWARWQAARIQDAEPAPLPAPPPVARRSTESDAFASGWRRARDAALQGDARRCLDALARIAPATVEGQARVRRLAFAAHVASGNRAAADSLFYLLAWNDDGRTGARLAAWRAWEARDVAALGRALEAMPDHGPGEFAAAAWIQWRSHPAEPDDALADGSRVPSGASGSAQAFLLLAAVRSALLEGDADLARERLRRVDPDRLPQAWQPVHVAAEAAVSGARSGEGTDAADFQAAETAYLAGDDARARGLLDAWLGRWPRSSWRGHAYLYRATLFLDAGDPDRAAEDVRAAARHGEGEVIPRAQLLSLFVAAVQGRPGDPQRTLEELRAGRLGTRDEGELLFARTRLERLVPGLDRTGLLRLEEAYPDSPWTARARAEADRPAVPPSPPRVALPAASGAPPPVDVPATGPWGTVLWGEDDLPRTARSLESDAGLETEPQPPVAAATPAPSPRSAPGWTGTVGLGGGARSTVFGEAGMAGSVDGMGVRVRADGVTTQEPGDLPQSTRGGLELGLSGGSDTRWTAVGEALGRSEKAFLPDGGGPGGPVSASWWGGRLDLDRGASAASWRRGQFALVDGELDVSRRGVWSSAQGWLRAEAHRAAGAGRWEAAGALGYLALREPGETAENLAVPDLRVVRRFAGGAYVGARGAYYRRQGLLLPVAGVETRLGAVALWAATEPGMELTPFRETFVTGGDWNLPDFDLAAARRDGDVRGGVRWQPSSRIDLSLRGEWFHADAYRTWRQEAGWWVESAVDEVVGRRLNARASWWGGSGVRIHVEGDLRSVRSSGNPVPYVPTAMARAQFGYDWSRWYVGGSLLGVRGRVDAAAREYGAFLRWDVEAAYRGRGSLEYTLRIENLGDTADRRWPGYPAYGRGVFAGIRALWGA